MDISVIIPSYNEGKYIEKTLRSIRNQKTKLKHEIIVSDCNSTDETVEIAKKYADKIVTSAKCGIANTRNLGAALAKGDILVFIDADTEISSDYLESAWQKFRKNSSLTGLSFSFKFSKRTPSLVFAEDITNSYLLMRSQLGKTTLPGFNTCILREKFKKIGGYKNVLLEDVKMSREIILIGKTEYLPQKKVITSSRKLEQLGLLGSLRYYFELDLMENNINLMEKEINLPFKNLTKVKNKILQKAIKNKIYLSIR